MEGSTQGAKYSETIGHVMILPGRRKVQPITLRSSDRGHARCEFPPRPDIRRSENALEEISVELSSSTE